MAPVARCVSSESRNRCESTAKRFFMPKATGSQWDFGELFPEEATRHVLSVSELTGQVRRLLEKQIGRGLELGFGRSLRLSGFIEHRSHSTGDRPLVLLVVAAIQGCVGATLPLLTFVFWLSSKSFWRRGLCRRSAPCSRVTSPSSTREVRPRCAGRTPTSCHHLRSGRSGRSFRGVVEQHFNRFVGSLRPVSTRFAAVAAPATEGGEAGSIGFDEDARHRLTPLRHSTQETFC